MMLLTYYKGIQVEAIYLQNIGPECQKNFEIPEFQIFAKLIFGLTLTYEYT